jgi:hypothetical protein
MCFCIRLRRLRLWHFYKNSRQGSRSALPLDPFRSGLARRTPTQAVEA